MRSYEQIAKTGITFGAENAGKGDTNFMGMLAKVNRTDCSVLYIILLGPVVRSSDGSLLLDLKK